MAAFSMHPNTYGPSHVRTTFSRYEMNPKYLLYNIKNLSRCFITIAPIQFKITYSEDNITESILELINNSLSIYKSA